MCYKFLQKYQKSKCRIQDDYSPNYSPDGKEIVFTSTDYITNPNPTHSSIWILNLKTSKATEVNVPDGKIMPYVDWSHNGKQLIFTSYDSPSQSAIYTINVDGTGKTLLNNENNPSDAHYSTNGKKIVYFSHIHEGTNDVSDIWTMDVDSRDKTKLTDNELDDSSPRFSPNGKEIVYASGVWQIHISGLWIPMVKTKSS